jgi:RNA 2',3'-cyclic 3'-phosphodiesterase
MRTRTFIAVAATDGVYDTAVRTIRHLSRITGAIKWVEPQNLHWTLHFLGELDDAEMFEVCRAAEESAAQLAPFTAVAGGVSTFGPITDPRTLWLGLTDGQEAFQSLYTTIQARLDALGYRGDRRKFVPHLTLGRVARNAAKGELNKLAEELAELQAVDAGPFAVDEITVFASRLRREGPDYQVYGTFELVGG